MISFPFKTQHSFDYKGRRDKLYHNSPSKDWTTKNPESSPDSSYSTSDDPSGESSTPYLFYEHLYLTTMLSAKLMKCDNSTSEICGGPLICPNWHEGAVPSDRRRPPEPLSKRPMKFVECRNPKCSFGDDCMYMHSWTEALHPELYKKGRCRKTHTYEDNLLLCSFKHPELYDTVAHHTREEACSKLLKSWKTRKVDMEKKREQKRIDRERQQEEARQALLDAVIGGSGKKKKRRRKKKNKGGRGRGGINAVTNRGGHDSRGSADCSGGGSYGSKNGKNKKVQQKKIEEKIKIKGSNEKLNNLISTLNINGNNHEDNNNVVKDIRDIEQQEDNNHKKEEEKEGKGGKMEYAQDYREDPLDFLDIFDGDPYDGDVLPSDALS